MTAGHIGKVFLPIPILLIGKKVERFLSLFQLLGSILPYISEAAARKAGGPT